MSARITNLGPSSRASNKLAFVVDNLVSRLASGGGATSISILDGTLRAGSDLVAESILQFVTGFTSGSDAMTISISGESSAALLLNALAVSPDFVASIARDFEALTILEGEARLAADSDALISGGIEFETIAASFSDASAFSVVFPTSLAVDDAEVSFESASLRAAGSLTDTFLGRVVHVTLRLAALSVLECPAIRAANSDARVFDESVVLRASQQDALSVSQGVTIGALASDALVTFEGEALRA